MSDQKPVVTMNDVLARLRDLQNLEQLFGATAEWQNRRSGLRQALAAAIMNEHGFTEPGQALSLPPETVLGEASRVAFDELKAFSEGAGSTKGATE